MNHYRKTIKLYKERKNVKNCQFCDANTLKNSIYQDNFIFIVPNLTKYDLWELHDVKDHLLIVPKRHVESLADLSDKERKAVIDKAAEYEKIGYNIYARGVDFAKRSIKHQHTHLIKVSNKKPRIAIFTAKPYFLYKK